MTLKNVARRAALENACKHGGRANQGAVMGVVMQAMPEAKKNPSVTAQIIGQIVKSVNALSLMEQKSELSKLGELKKPKRKAHGMFDFLKIPAGTKVTSCFPPEPSKYPHIGHAKSMVVNYLLAKEHNGTFILRYDDTNPDLAQKEFYDIILDNLSWLGTKPDKVIYASEHLKKIDAYAEKLIATGNAYVCNCPAEVMSQLRRERKICEHWQQDKNEALTQFKTLKEGSVLRLKLDMTSDNTTFRDPVMYRIINKPHPRVKGRTKWPSYDFETAVLDGMEAINYRIRGKEFELRGPLQRKIQELLELPITTTYEFARFDIKGATTSGREIREGIQKKQFLGWDDPSLVTLVALRRRGFQPEAIKKFLLSTGFSKSEAVLEWEDLIKHNRRLLDERANRYFLISDPEELTIKGAPNKKVCLNLNPNERKGGRMLEVNENFLIEKKDAKHMKKGKLYRLMDCLNFKDGTFVEGGIDAYRKAGAGIMHFLPKKGNIRVTVMMPDKTLLQGLAEPAISKVEEGQVVQFERFGFARLDDPKQMLFYYTHP